MTRPITYTPSRNLPCCANCKHSLVLAERLDLLCARGDAVVVLEQSSFPIDTVFAVINGVDPLLMDDNQYESFVANRLCDADGVCDKFEVEDQ